METRSAFLLRWCRARILERGAIVLGFSDRFFPRRQFLIDCWRSGIISRAASLAGLTPRARSAALSLGSLLDRSYLWQADARIHHNCFLVFRHHINVPAGSSSALLHIFADTRYVAYLNGSRLASGPARFDFRFPEYDSLPLAGRLRPGRNVLAVLVQSLGAANAWSTVHAPGLTYVLEWKDAAGVHRVASNASARCRPMEAWDERAPVGWPYAAEWLDASRLPSGWNQVEFDDSGWEPAQPVAHPSWGPLQPRSIPLLRETRIHSPEVTRVDTDEGHTPQWIWHDEVFPSSVEMDRRAASGRRRFRWIFQASRPGLAGELRLAAGGDYALYVNGTLLARRNVLAEPQGLIHFSDADRLRQAARQVDRYPIERYLRAGDNLVALEVLHHLYENRPGSRSPAGLLAQLILRDGETVSTLTSDASWTSSEQSFDGWEQPSFTAVSWRRVRVLGPYGIEPWSLKLGTFPFRVSRRVSGASQLPATLRQGQRAIVDFGSVKLAIPQLRLEADAGCELQMIYAEKLLPSGEPEVSFAPDRYTCRAGEQEWAPTDSRGFRYLVLSAEGGSQKISSVAAAERLYPVDVEGSFSCDDTQLAQLWPRCVETLRQCMEDAYVDTAWRERAQWLADMVACGFHANLAAFGDTALFRRLLLQMGQSQDVSGRLASDGWDLLTMDQGQRISRDHLEPGWIWAHYPSDRNDVHRYLEDYMLIWVIGIRKYYEQTLDGAFVRSEWPRIARLLEWFDTHRTSRGLVRGRDFVYFGNPVAYLTGEGAALNILYLMALSDTAFMARALGESRAAVTYNSLAESLRKAIQVHLKQPASELYLAMLEDEKIHPPSLHANILALLSGLVPTNREDVVLDWIAAGLMREQETVSPYMHYWLFEMLYQRGDAEKGARLVLDQVRRKWGPLVRLGVPTMPEFFSQAESTESSGVSGSACHIAGTLPAWVLSAGVLGVRVVERDGKREVRIRPRLGGLEWAKGSVPSVLGRVTVSHHSEPRRWRSEVTIPQAAPAWFGLPESFPRASLRLDGSAIPQVDTAAGAHWFTITPGSHVIEARA